MDPQYIGEYLYKHGLMMNKKKELLQNMITAQKDKMAQMQS